MTFQSPGRRRSTTCGRIPERTWPTQLLDGARSSILAHNSQGVIRFVNAATCTLLRTCGSPSCWPARFDTRWWSGCPHDGRRAPCAVKLPAVGGRQLHARRHDPGRQLRSLVRRRRDQGSAGDWTPCSSNGPGPGSRLRQRGGTACSCTRADGEDGGRAGRRRAGAGRRGRGPRRRRGRGRVGGRGTVRLGALRPRRTRTAARWWPRCAVRRPRAAAAEHLANAPWADTAPWPAARPVGVVPRRRRPRSARSSRFPATACPRARSSWCGTPRSGPPRRPARRPGGRVRPACGHRGGGRGDLRPPGAPAGVLRTSLLQPSLPRVPGLTLGAAYRPAEEGC